MSVPSTAFQHGQHAYVELCPHGCVCLMLGAAVIHLRPTEFHALLRAMNGIAPRLQPGSLEERQ